MAAVPASNSVLEHFASLPDPRHARGRLHVLGDVLTLAICAVVCGADSWAEVEQFARAKEAWFRTFLSLPAGVPSHDTFGRVFAALDPDAFERCFVAWTAAVAGSSRGRLVAVDGKAIRRGFRRAWDRAAGRAVTLVSAFAEANGVVLGQVAVDAKSNEITAIPKLLELLDLRGATVTIDAMGCQREVAAAIVAKGGDYVLSLKGNQSALHEKVRVLLDASITERFAGGMSHGHHESTDGGHGRVEVRRTWVTDEVQWLGPDLLALWPGLATGSVGVVESVRQDLGDLSGRVTTERRYFISSLAGVDAGRFAAAVRGHWSVENGLHWSLDVGFGEDRCRARVGHAAENFSRLRRLSLNLLRGDRTVKVGIKGKRLRAGWDHDYLLKVLTG